MKAQQDLAELCNHPSLELKLNGGKPHASFYLKPQQRKDVMRWMKWLKFPDGYAVGLRRSMNMMTGKLIGLNCHHYHIIMERPPSYYFSGLF
jgi:hypothetical protein